MHILERQKHAERVLTMIVLTSQATNQLSGSELIFYSQS
uniref:Uncharacterized protein n=1 Tax=Arundo donax TaxID=35708 RepID=A0A0A9CXY6_ARUDO